MRLCKLMLLVAIVGLSLPLTATSALAVSPVGGRIAFASNLSSGNVSTVAPAGSDRDSVGPGRYPQWSPDGSQIIGDTSQGSNIWVANPDGSDRHAIYTAPRGWSVYTPTWSPDGKQIAFISHKLTQDWELRAVTLATGDVIDITSNDGREWAPSWSPDGAYIAYQGIARSSEPDGFYLRELSTGNEILIPNTDVTEHVDWSPDSSTLVWADSGGLRLWNIDGASPPSAVPNVSGSATRYGASFSPDGTHILFDQNGDLFQIDPDGTNKVQLTTGAANDILPDQQPLFVSITASKHAITFGDKARVTAHLLVADQTANHTVQLFQSVSGNPFKKVAATDADTEGVARFTVQPAHNAEYYVRWAGDTTSGAAKSSTVKVGVHQWISGKLKGGYDTKHGIRLYHVGKTVYFLARLLPVTSGKHLEVVLKYNFGSGWRVAFDKLYATNNRGYLGLAISQVPRGSYRLYAAASATHANLDSREVMRPFRVTA